MKFVIFLCALCSFSQDFFEARLTNNQYRYIDWSHSFKNKLITDMYYVGIPGNNELSACIGYSLPSKFKLSVTPFVCGVTTKEEKKVDVKIATTIFWEQGKWKADAYLAHFQPLKGTTNPYSLLDAGNLTHSVTKNWEAGISTGFFLQMGKWNPQYGPIFRRNDKLGSWGLSLRTGVTKELRIIRTIILKR